MPNNILHKFSSTANVAPAAGALVPRELAINTADGRLFTKTVVGTVVEFARTTSPTFVTPALGTPASGVVTNLTGTASININGTVGATTASTGRFTSVTSTTLGAFFSGTSAPASGESVEIKHSSGVGSILSYDRTAALYRNLIIAAATTDILVNGTTKVSVSTNGLGITGTLGVNAAPITTTGIYINQTGLTGAAQTGVWAGVVGTVAATTSVIGIITRVETVGSGQTVASVRGLEARDAVKGATSVITSLSGLYVNDQTAGTNNFGLISLVSAGASKWNIYAGGTAQNAFAGNVRIGSTVIPTAALDVTGAIVVTGIAGSTASAVGQAITLTGSSQSGLSASGSAVVITGGAGTNSTATSGGNVTITGGASSTSTGGGSGSVSLVGGASVGGNGGNINLTGVGSTGFGGNINLTVGASGFLNFSSGIGVAKGTVATTFSTALAPAGSTGGAIDGWLRIQVAGVTKYIPYWA